MATALAYFNPRSPCGERHKSKYVRKAVASFQSTLPVWGATIDHRSHAERKLISIHAPRVGSDSIAALTAALEFYFNPRSPCGERPRLAATLRPQSRISIHAPRVGSDLTDKEVWQFEKISIHAPRVGSDRTHARAKAKNKPFQSTLPVWGATRSRPITGR